MTVDPWIFWGLCAMAGIGFLQAAATVFTRDDEKEEDWTKTKFSPPGEAPEGFIWALIKSEEGPPAPPPAPTRGLEKREIEDRWKRFVAAEKAREKRERQEER